MIKRIHVNQHHIKSNNKTGNYKPVFTAKTSRTNDYGYEAAINGPCKVIYI